MIRIKHKAIVLSFSLLFSGELLVFFGFLELGIGVHIINLQGICFSMIRGKRKKPPGNKKTAKELALRDILDKRILQALLLPLQLRIINTAMPIFFTTTLYWFPLIYSPLFVSIYTLLKHQRSTLKSIGLSYDKIYLFLPLGFFIGILLARLEYDILQPRPMIPDAGIANLIVLSLIMYAFIALVEEIIFRSILQTRLEKAFGMPQGLLITSLIFGIMHSGYGIASEILFAIFAGIVVGYIFQKTRSLPMVVTIHGTLNLFLFGLIPLSAI